MAIIKSSGHKEARLTAPPQAHVWNSILLWFYQCTFYSAEIGGRKDAVREAHDAIVQVLLS